MQKWSSYRVSLNPNWFYRSNFFILSTKNKQALAIHQHLSCKSGSVINKRLIGWSWIERSIQKCYSRFDRNTLCRSQLVLILSKRDKGWILELTNPIGNKPNNQVSFDTLLWWHQSEWMILLCPFEWIIIHDRELRIYNWKILAGYEGRERQTFGHYF